MLQLRWRVLSNRHIRRVHTPLNRDPYKVLGVKRNATTAEIKKAFLSLAKQYHPDVNKSPSAKQIYHDASASYEILKDRDKRAQYDAKSGLDQQTFYNPPPFRERSSSSRDRANFQSYTNKEFTKWYTNQFGREAREFSKAFGNRPPFETKWGKSTIEQDIFGNIRIKTTYKNTTDAHVHSTAHRERRFSSNLNRGRQDAWSSLWSFLTKGVTYDERPTFLDFPRSFTMIRRKRTSNTYDMLSRNTGQFQTIGRIRETKQGQTTHLVYEHQAHPAGEVKVLAKAHGVIDALGLQKITIEDPSSVKIATIKDTKRPNLFLPRLFHKFVILDASDKVLGHIISYQFFYDIMIFLDTDMVRVGVASGQIDPFSMREDVQYDVQILTSSVWDAAIYIFPPAFRGLLKQRNPSIFSRIKDLVDSFAKKP